MKKALSASGRAPRLLMALLALLMVTPVAACVKEGTTTGDVIPRAPLTLSDDRTALPACATKKSDCYTQEQMPKYAAAAFSAVWNGFYKGLNRKYDQNKYERPQLVLVPAGKNVKTACNEANFVKQMANADNTFFWCNNDNTVYVGANMLWKLYQQGDVAPAAALAHELGHHRQTAVYINLLAKDTTDELQVEDQADCISGAAMNQVRFKKNSDEQQAADNDGRKKYFAYLDSLAKRRIYKDNERRNAFNDGAKRGLDYCNHYFPKQKLGKD